MRQFENKIAMKIVAKPEYKCSMNMAFMEKLKSDLVYFIFGSFAFIFTRTIFFFIIMLSVVLV